LPEYQTVQYLGGA